MYFLLVILRILSKFFLVRHVLLESEIIFNPVEPDHQPGNLAHKLNDPQMLPVLLAGLYPQRSYQKSIT